jgi:hypothetical protein
MKKSLLITALLAVSGMTALAGMEALDFTPAGVTNLGTVVRAYTVRGALEGVYVIVPANATGTVTVTSGEQTLFNKSCTATAFYPILIPAYGTTASALTFVGGSNNVANPWYVKPVMAGLVSNQVVGASGGTNTWTTRLLYTP